MITFYSGTPGSGKSLHVARRVYTELRLRRNVISTVDISLDAVRRNNKSMRLGDFVYKPITEINPEFLYRYALQNHRKGKEGQTLVILDECQIIFNPREFGKTGRLDWINFFTQHRHLGYNFILISQFDRLVDRQIRSLFEYEVKHRKVNNFGLMWLFPVTLFVSVTVWYGLREKMGSEFFFYSKKHAKMYDSYVMFDRFLAENGINETDGGAADGCDDSSFDGTDTADIDGTAPPPPPQAGVGGTPPKVGRGARSRRRRFFGWFRRRRLTRRPPRKWFICVALGLLAVVVVLAAVCDIAAIPLPRLVPPF